MCSFQTSYAGSWEQDLGDGGIPEQVDGRDAPEGQPQAVLDHRAGQPRGIQGDWCHQGQGPGSVQTRGHIQRKRQSDG